MSTDLGRVTAPEPARAEVCDVFASEWLASTLRTYPAHTAGLLRDERSPFRNPVGSTLRTALGGLSRELFGGFDRDRVVAMLEGVVRIRVVQDLPPADTLDFVELARRAVAGPAVMGAASAGAVRLDVVAARIDELGQLAQQCLARCRDDMKAIGERAARRREFVFERIDARLAARAAGGVGARPPASRGGLP